MGACPSTASRQLPYDGNVRSHGWAVHGLTSRGLWFWELQLVVLSWPRLATVIMAVLSSQGQQQRRARLPLGSRSVPAGH
ncbi:hypothetical protein [Myxococcus sp. AB025B]|uniref:hypothetical protein n=1 Tax=Myxococcus sp. AB025B TaxID=2562794 RepID=UPI001141BAB1|nr:hypothetical protein [Myxococcus sp. AB025B]